MSHISLSLNKRLYKFAKVYDQFFSMSNAPFVLEPEMIVKYTKRNNLTPEQAQYLLERPHYIYASQAVSILEGTFNMRDYYRIRSPDYYTKPLEEFLHDELRKLGLLEKRQQFAIKQQIKLKQNIRNVSALFVHGEIKPGFVKLPDDLTLCFLAQPFHAMTSATNELIYQLQDDDASEYIMENPVCFSKLQNNDTYKNMVVYYPGQMVPNAVFSPELSINKSNSDTIFGYFSPSDIAQKPVVYDTNQRKYIIQRHTPYIGLGRSSVNDEETVKTYKSFTLQQLIESTSIVGKVSGVVILNACRVNPDATSYEHEIVSRYETFMNIFNYVIDNCERVTASTYKAIYGNVKSKYKHDLPYYQHIMHNHIPFFDYRLTPDFIFTKLTAKITKTGFPVSNVMRSLIRRSFILDKILRRSSHANIISGGHDKMLDLMRTRYSSIDLATPKYLVTRIMAYIDINETTAVLPLLDVLIGDQHIPNRLQYLAEITESAVYKSMNSVIDYIFDRVPDILTKTQVINEVISYYEANPDMATDAHIQIGFKMTKLILKHAKLRNSGNAYAKINQIFKLFKYPSLLSLLIQQVEDVNVLLGRTVNNGTFKETVPFYFLVLYILINYSKKHEMRSIIKLLVEKRMNMDISQTTESGDKVYIFPYLCGKYADKYKLNTQRDNNFHNLISALTSIGAFTAQPDNSACRNIVISALQTKCIPALKYMMLFVYTPDNPATIDLFADIINLNDELFISLLDYIPYRPGHTFWDKPTSDGEYIRDLLPTAMLARLDTQQQTTHTQTRRRTKKNRQHELQYASGNNNTGWVDNNTIFANKYSKAYKTLRNKMGKYDYRV